MRKIAVIAWREIVEYQTFVWAGLGALAVTLVVPLLPGFFGWSPAEIREVLMWGMALGFTWLGAIFLGASTVSGTVASGRFGFFVSRPLSGPAIWFGKLLGVVAVLLICEVIVLVPAAVLTDPVSYASDLGQDPWAWMGFIAGVPPLLVLLAHAVSTMWRARTVWIGLDLLALLTTGTVGWLTISALLKAEAEVAATVVGLAMAIAAMVVLLGAGAHQVSAGRCDPRRQHQALSCALWPALLALVVGLAGYGWWLRTPGVGDLRGADSGLVMNPSGEWIAVSGSSRQRWDVDATFIVNLDSRESVRLGIGRSGGGSRLAFSGDGRRAAWPVPEGDRWRIRVATMDGLLAGGGDTAIFLDHRPWLVLSHRGDRTAMIDEGTLVVFDLPSGDLAGSVRLPARRSHFGPYFASDDCVGIILSEPAEGFRGPPSLRALEFDLVDRKLVEVGFLPAVGQLSSVTIDRSRNRLLLGAAIDGRMSWRYLDSRTFAEIPWADEIDLGPAVSMLADGRLVRLVNASSGSRLEVLSPDGEIRRDVPLPRVPKGLKFGFQPTHSTLVVAVSEERSGLWWFEDWAARLVDLETGEIREIGREIVPANWWFRHGTPTQPLPAGCAAGRLFIDGKSSLWLWDQQAGRMEQLVAGRW